MFWVDRLTYAGESYIGEDGGDGFSVARDPGTANWILGQDLCHECGHRDQLA